MDLEESLGFSGLEIYREYVDKMKKIKKELFAMLTDFRDKKKIIAGYGAAIGTTTLSYYFELGGKLNWLFDDNKSRHGMFSPGQHIPVLASNEIYDKRPDYIIIFPWRYASQIIKRHQRYLQEGGKFIIPLPRLQIIQQ